MRFFAETYAEDCICMDQSVKVEGKLLGTGPMSEALMQKCP